MNVAIISISMLLNRYMNNLIAKGELETMLYAFIIVKYTSMLRAISETKLCKLIPCEIL